MPWPSPRGAPGEAPPWMRHRPLSIAGDRQDWPARFRAPQRGTAWAIGSVMRQSGRRSTGLPFIFRSAPPSSPPSGIAFSRAP
jgi:hypothetical protein